MPTSSFSFLGFIPKKLNQKRVFFSELKYEKHTIVVFESAKRVKNTLENLESEYSANKKIAVWKSNKKKIFDILNQCQ